MEISYAEWEGVPEEAAAVGELTAEEGSRSLRDVYEEGDLRDMRSKDEAETSPLVTLDDLVGIVSFVGSDTVVDMEFRRRRDDCFDGGGGGDVMVFFLLV